MRSIEELIDNLITRQTEIGMKAAIDEFFVEVDKLRDAACRHVNPISGNRWDKVFVPDCKINFCPNCGVKLEEA